MNNISVSFAELLPIMNEKLQSGGKVSFTVSGTSMQPLIFDRKDTVTLKKFAGKLKKYDVPFYRRDDGQFVLHRVIKVEKDGSYVCRGDNQNVKEFGVRDAQVIGVMTSFTRRGKQVEVDKSFGYKFYCRAWQVLRHFRLMGYYFGRIKGIFKKK